MSADAITTENWGYPPYNRRSFQQVQALFPTARICRGSGPVTAFAEDHRDLSNIEFEGLEGQQRSVRQMLDDTCTDAFLVVKDGVILTEEYVNGMRADSHHLLNSVSKSFVGMLAGVLAAEGLLDPAEKVVTYLSEFEDTAFAETTVQHALDMTAAVKYGEDYADRHADFWVETAIVGWRPALVHDQSATTLFDFARSLTETEQSEGEHFHYRTVLTNVIAMVIERVTNQKFQQLLEERIWQKLGPEQDAAIVVDRTGFPYVGAGMNACARDLARFGQMLLQDGHYNDTQIVPAAWIKATRQGTDESRRLFAATDYAATMPGGHYHNQIWADSARELLICIGIHGQTIHVDQRTGVVIVKLSTHPEPVDTSLFGDTFRAMEALSAAL